MKCRAVISLFLLLLWSQAVYAVNVNVSFNFCGETISFQYESGKFVDFNGLLSTAAVSEFYREMEEAGYDETIAALKAYREKDKPDDWLYYQLIRRTAQHISPKAENYNRYTLYKWYFMCKTGYDATLSISADKLLFYVQSDDAIYDIPKHVQNGRQYVCLNYHDFDAVDFKKEHFERIGVNDITHTHSFSYKITHLPDFRAEDYTDKNLEFNYYNSEYRFRVKVNNEIKTLFANYPVTDYESYFEMPLSSGTYSSLMPALKQYMKKMSQQEGVDYLMRFTRYAFLYETDRQNFGKEKRFSPEQTLLYDYSDCEDRSALFFYLVKEIYNLPMIVLAFPEHVTIAVKFDKPVGKPIIYQGSQYSVCEPTPQKEDLHVGELSRELKRASYEVVYAYQP